VLEYPLRVTINNGSRWWTVSNSSWYVSAQLPGRSTNIASYQEYQTDQIIKPQEAFVLCYSAPALSETADPSTIVWGISSRSISFSN